MAIKSADQITLVDVTDAYSVILTSESHTFIGNAKNALAGTATTQVYAMRGAETMTATVVLSEIQKPAGVNITSDNKSPSPTLSISVTTAVTKPGVVKIPVHIGDITIHKEFSFAIAFKGNDGQNGTNGTDGQDGAPGKDGVNGVDAFVLTVTSSNGTIFKNSAISTVLTAHLFKGGAEIEDISQFGTVKWYKDGGPSPVGTGQSLTIDPKSVVNKATYVAQLEG